MVAATLLVAPPAAHAADPDAAIVVTLPSDLAADERAAFLEALGRLDTAVAVANAPAATAADGVPE